jgi:hypothetical protein
MKEILTRARDAEARAIADLAVLDAAAAETAEAIGFFSVKYPYPIFYRREKQMEERAMTDGQFQAFIEMVVQIVKYSPDVDEAVRRLYSVRRKFAEKFAEENEE